MRDHGAILGKAEVGSSILPNGTIKPLGNKDSARAKARGAANAPLQIHAEHVRNAPIAPGDRREVCARVVRAPSHEQAVWATP